MEKHTTRKGPSRRAFLAGIIAGLGTAGAAMASKRVSQSVRHEPEAPSTDTVLYRRTEEAERYYKTLYT